MEILKLAAQAIFFKEVGNVGSKLLHNQRITKTDEQILGLAAIAYLLVNLPPANQNGQLNN